MSCPPCARLAWWSLLHSTLSQIFHPATPSCSLNRVHRFNTQVPCLSRAGAPSHDPPPKLHNQACQPAGGRLRAPSTSTHNCQASAYTHSPPESTADGQVPTHTLHLRLPPNGGRAPPCDPRPALHHHQDLVPTFV